MQLYTKESIDIDAPVSKVWEIVTKPSHIKQWEDFVGDYGDDSPLEVGREIIWKDGEDHLKGMVTGLEPLTLIRVSFRDSTWERAIPPEDFTYVLELFSTGEHTLATITKGDYKKIPHSEKIYTKAHESNELAKIKKLAEK